MRDENNAGRQVQQTVSLRSGYRNLQDRAERKRREKGDGRKYGFEEERYIYDTD